MSTNKYHSVLFKIIVPGVREHWKYDQVWYSNRGIFRIKRDWTNSLGKKELGWRGIILIAHKLLEFIFSRVPTIVPFTGECSINTWKVDEWMIEFGGLA